MLGLCAGGVFGLCAGGALGLGAGAIGRGAGAALGLGAAAGLAAGRALDLCGVLASRTAARYWYVHGQQACTSKYQYECERTIPATSCAFDGSQLRTSTSWSTSRSIMRTGAGAAKTAMAQARRTDVQVSCRNCMIVTLKGREGVARKKGGEEVEGNYGPATAEV